MLPRGIADRTIKGLFALLFGVMLSEVLLGFPRWTVRPDERLLKAVLEHVLVCSLLLCAAVLVWSLFTPRWLERLMVRMRTHVLATLVTVILLSAASIVIAFSGF